MRLMHFLKTILGGEDTLLFIVVVTDDDIFLFETAYQHFSHSSQHLSALGVAAIAVQAACVMS